MAGVSWINVRPVGRRYLVVFLIALQLPFADPALPEEICTVSLRMWPDQIRILESDVPLEDQIRELHLTRILGNLAAVYLSKTGEAAGLWVIETHAGSPEERLAWVKSIVEMEGSSSLS